MRKTKEEAEQTRKDIMKAALHVFSEVGYSASKLADIAEQAEVTRGAIYHHFNNKAELYKELLNEYSERGNHLIGAAINEGGTLVDILARTLVYQMQALEDDPELRAVIELSLFKTANDPELAEVMEGRRQQTSGLVQMLTGVMAQGIEAGFLRPELNPETAARAFAAYQQGITYLWLFNPQAFSIKEQAEDLTNVFLYGLVRQ